MASLFQIVGAPDAASTLRFLWLRDSPEGPSDIDDVSSLAVPSGEVAGVGLAVDRTLEEAGLLTLAGSVPVPEGWPAGGSGPHLGGLALLGPNLDLLAVRWLYPSIDPASGVRSVGVTVTAIRSAADAGAS